MSSMAWGTVQYSLCSLAILLWCILSIVLNDQLELFCVAIHVSCYILGCLCLFLQLIFTCIQPISSALSSLWFCLDSQSAMKRSEPSLYIILTLYWCILRSNCCSFCNNVVTSFLNIATSGLWYVIIFISLVKQ